MKYIKFFIYILLLSFSIVQLNCMDKAKEGKKSLSYEQFLQEETKSEEMTQKEIQEFTQQNQELQKTYLDVDRSLLERSRIKINSQRYAYLASCALATGPDMPNSEKLKYVVGDYNWEDRKQIIREMIEKQKINPNNIVYRRGTKTPLKESVKYDDIPFTMYLLQKGAIVTQEILPLAVSQEMCSLLKNHL